MLGTGFAWAVTTKAMRKRFLAETLEVSDNMRLDIFRLEDFTAQLNGSTF